MSVDLDTSDKIAVYGIIGGLVCGFINANNRAKVPFNKNKKFMGQYYALFGSMGCLAAALGNFIFPNVDTEAMGLLGGALGSYFLLGVENYI